MSSSVRWILAIFMVACALGGCGDDASEDTSTDGGSSGSGGGGGTDGGSSGSGGTDGGSSGTGGSGGSSDAGGDGVPQTGAVNIAVGSHSACALLEDGHVWCWGAITGLTTMEGQSAPVMTARAVQVEDLEGVVALRKADDDTTCAVLEAGGVVCWSIDPSSPTFHLPGAGAEPAVVEGVEDV